MNPEPFTSSITVDGRHLPATPRRYFETAEGGVLDVQAVLGDAPLVYVGEAALTATGVRGLSAHLAELAGVLP